MPRISVLMTVYNTRPDYLREAVNSILTQSFTDFELLIFDDGSTDPEVRPTLESFSDPRIRLILSNCNGGISRARNALLDEAAGEYLAVKDSDDISLPDRLAEQAAYLDAHPDIGVVGAAIRRLPSGKIRVCPLSHEEIVDGLMYECVIEHPVAMIRRSALGTLRYDETLGVAEDHQLWCDLIGKTRFANLPRVLLEYRVHSGGITHTFGKKGREQHGRVVDSVRRAHPELWKRAQKNVIVERKYKLFGILKMFTTWTRGDHIRYFIAGFPIATRPVATPPRLTAPGWVTVRTEGRKTKYLLGNTLLLLAVNRREELFKTFS